jgi:NAD(P)-dependent dehydrogenase (short-subunit alcohol dehydrogenase family)
MSSVVLITGASTGFGREAAERLARRGHYVFATMRESDGRNAGHRLAIEQLAATEGVRLEVLELDVTDEASVQGAVEKALSRAGRLDVVINNAGYAALGVTEAFTPEQFEQIFQVNVFGVVRVNRAVLPSMRQQRSGVLIHVSSGAGRCVVPTMAAYCASKFALEAIADAYRYELLPFGIDSILIEPGIYRTPIFDRVVRPADDERLAQYGAATEYAERVLGVFHGAIAAPDNPGSDEVAEALVQLVDMPPADRPFRTVVPEPIRQLLQGYNDAAEALRPVVAQIFSVPDLTGAPRPAATALPGAAAG